MRRSLFLILILLAFGLACGSSDDQPKASSPSPSPASSPAAASATVATTVSASADEPLYIALGDSLSEGVGATDPGSKAFVPFVHQGLGDGVGLINLGESGDTSAQLLSHGHVDAAVAEIEKRKKDGDPNNDVTLVTLEIGGNDLLNLYFQLVLPGTCPNITEALKKPQCVDALRQALDTFRPNLKAALDDLQAADPDLRIVLMTLYNPFSGGLQAFDPVGQLALEGTPDTPFTEGLNDTIRAQAGESGVILVDVYPLFVGKAGEYVSQDLIHPNDKGYRVMADAVLAAIGTSPP